jgi:hypothetical protein
MKLGMLTQCFCSGLARSVGRFARPGATASTSFRRPQFAKQFVPAIGARLASTASAKEGKIHQVIGAIVDGKLNLPGPRMKAFSLMH